MCTKAEPCEEEHVFQDHWNTKLRFWLSLAHASALWWRFPPVFVHPFLPFSSSKCLSHHSHTPPLPKPLWVLMPFTIEHHQPPAEHYQDVFFWVCLPPSLRIWLSPSPFWSLHHPSILLPWTPYQMYHSIWCVLSTPSCSYPLPSCQNILLSSTSSPKSL